MLTSSQGTAGPTATRLTAVPPGPGVLVLANLGTASPVYVGFSAAPGASGSVSTANGFPLTLGVVPLVIPLYAGNAGGSLSAVTASGSANIGWMFSTATGQTGP